MAQSWTVLGPETAVVVTPVEPIVTVDSTIFSIDHRARLEWAARTGLANLNVKHTDGSPAPWLPGLVFGNCPELADILKQFLASLLEGD